MNSCCYYITTSNV